ncbi:TPA: sigma-70 family RNA polymerase sigma factor [Candidatus Poribacteria bacterium]|jgi:RNA polymerase sigma-70 factor (ECF subfamily)|nr:sigma-70 family RNA polymerase sigma factor [Candidatus Poribacteria bacterium]HIB89086.1 sigma-70 family RNA polymerase sigma factor [Candidatus Poribacteria bacterium]HIC01479.1 sigma-70 family RNA polymerase sigma factor [Candidatus Poribacteria bacterium]HIN27646.1 sigma-70 family RNA polymerase sigma factor [Candidatus Poribacteria bacterium]HIO05552.1 sigma-70 family RNA polymerase sigma factor [Candidatus Poribacteria bacterium]
MKDVPDHFFVQKVKSGDTEAFGELVRRYQKRIYELAYRFARHPEEAYDLSQEIFLKAFNALDRFRGSSGFYTWLYKIAQNTCIDYTRRKSTWSELPFSNDFPLDDSWLHPRTIDDFTTKSLEIQELSKEINSAINQLSSRQKQVFILRHYEGLALRDIADVLDLKVGSVKAHLFNAIRKLRIRLTPYI